MIAIWSIENVHKTITNKTIRRFSEIKTKKNKFFNSYTHRRASVQRALECFAYCLRIYRINIDYGGVGEVKNHQRKADFARVNGRVSVINKIMRAVDVPKYSVTT